MYDLRFTFLFHFLQFHNLGIGHRGGVFAWGYGAEVRIIFIACCIVL